MDYWHSLLFFQHKVSKMLVVENQYIYSEDLNPSILNRGHRMRLSGNTSGTEGTDKSVKPVDTGKVAYLEQEACNATDGWIETHPSSVGG